MKLYLLDRALYLFAGILLVIGSCIYFPTVLAVIAVILIVLSWGIICYPLVLLPLDFVLGRKNELLYFSTQLGLEELEFFKRRYICEWKFVNSKKQLNLMIPLSYSKEQISQSSFPPHDRLLRVTYYPFSKIMVSWELEPEKRLPRQ